MPVAKTKRSSGRKQNTNPHGIPFTGFKSCPRNLASLTRGLYKRVAYCLSFDPSYVSRVARGERRSEMIEAELRRELNRIIEHLNNQRKTR